MKRTLEGGQDLLQVRAALDERGVGEVAGRGVRVDGRDGMARACRRPQRQDTPVAVVVRLDEMIDPGAGLQPQEVGAHRAGVEGQRQLEAISHASSRGGVAGSLAGTRWLKQASYTIRSASEPTMGTMKRTSDPSVW